MFESILLGILQGLTEFLPVSSSGHLVLAQSLLPGFDGTPAAFDILLHGGTLVAVTAYFRADIGRIVRDCGRPSEEGLRLPILLIVGSVPAGMVGVLFADAIVPLFAAPRIASLGLVFTAALLFAAFRLGTGSGRTLAGLTIPAAFLIGAFQAMALVPGVSRSGATIAAGIFMGLSGPNAARFSFLLSIPAIAGALVLESGDLLYTGLPLPYIAGAVAAAVAGWASIALLMRILDRGNLLPFAVYCLLVGVLSLLFLI
ncbi:MAG: undecaprenyl-diphosphate phosphatase [bacterium]|nr:undecaprenyl-diphosphate phosphatase [bacterium]MDT8395193.1 undecaprenyl-diphosphate phosphatase [bacterium]